MWRSPSTTTTCIGNAKSAPPAGQISTLDAALAANPGEWIYSVPISGESGFYCAPLYDYYLVRGYAVVEASGIGTYGSESFELCGTHLERDSHKAVVEWLTGDRVAYTDKTSNIQIKADWCNGKVAMTGCSYGGTLPFEVATTGVKGLETIIPFAGIASWYDYTNSQGVPTILEVNCADSLAAYNCGGTFLDRDWTVSNREYGSWLWQISEDQFATNGNYGPIWEESDYAKDWAGIRCSALIVQGVNDFNVNATHADKMFQAFQKAGKNVKLVLHQDGHNFLNDHIVNGELWQQIMNRWLAHYLYGVDNGAENMPTLLAQSSLDGSWTAYDSWRDFDYIEAAVSADAPSTQITSEGLNDIASQYLIEQNPDLNGSEHREQYFMELDPAHIAVYPIELPENTTVCGVPEIHVRLSNENVDYEGLMVSAVLIDQADDGQLFPAYMLENRLSMVLTLCLLAGTLAVACAEQPSRFYQIKYPVYIGDMDTTFENPQPLFFFDDVDDLHSGYNLPSWMMGLDDIEGKASASDRALGAHIRQYKALRKAAMGDKIPGYQEVGNTAYVTFDSFESRSASNYYDAFEAGETIPDTIGLIINARQQIYREGSPVENVVIDLSNNTGGSVNAALFVISWILGEAEVSVEDAFTGAQSTMVYRADINLDRAFDEKDTLADKRVYCLISPISFSCGNLVPAVCKAHHAVTLIGRTSGGGTCTVQPMSTAWGTVLQISGANRMSFRKNGSFYDIDEGIEPDIYIDHLETLYDREALTALINGLR